MILQDFAIVTAQVIEFCEIKAELQVDYKLQLLFSNALLSSCFRRFRIFMTISFSLVRLF